jgi:hypothetical protein
MLSPNERQIIVTVNTKKMLDDLKIGRESYNSVVLRAIQALSK